MSEIDLAIQKIKDSSSIVVFTGAGVSTNCGIPDFRGPDGLYSYVQEKYNLPTPESIFELSYFEEHPEVFYLFSKELDFDNIKPSITHKMIADLENIHKKIEIVVTQNIDYLHEKAGTKKIIACHGTYESGRCLSCGKTFKLSDYKQNLVSGEVKYCDCKGVVKPDITFFGEQLPQNFYSIMDNPPKADLLLVMGTSLTVQPASFFPLEYLRQKIDSIIVNRDPTSYDAFFTHKISLDCDYFSNELINEL